jgi:hypothetical protein
MKNVVEVETLSTLCKITTIRKTRLNSLLSGTGPSEGSGRGALCSLYIRILLIRKDKETNENARLRKHRCRSVKCGIIKGM